MVEIKVAESWSLSQLEDALIKQLRGQYLQAQNGREGILLLVHQSARKNGWKLPGGSLIGFSEVVVRLRQHASEIRAESSTGPQRQVCVLDVSSCAKDKKSPSRNPH